MESDIQALLKEVRNLRDDLKPAAESVFKKIGYVLEKLVIPVMLGVVAWAGTQAATEISKGQLNLAASAAEDRKAEFRRAMQAKYIEIFYKDLNSGDQKSQLNAIRLVRLVDGELAQTLLDLVAITPGVSEAVVAKAGEARSALEALLPLRGYKVGIYFHKNDPPSVSTVLKLQDRLKAAGFTGTVQPFPSDEAFFARPNNLALTLEVRYEDGIEDEASDALLGIVQRVDDRTQWRKQLVSNRTANFLSIFVPRGG